MSIYKATTIPLNRIVADACCGKIMVPDIQRAYVWSPDKVVRLIDSFLKGWPFSTLLLWKTGQANGASDLIPHRPFKRKVSRVEPFISSQEKFQVGVDLPSDNITMILDGQQRIQSILMAFSGHDSGLYLLDKEWYSSFSDDGDHPYRGSRVNNRWCYGQLYLDLSELIQNVEKTSRRGYTLKSSVDWTKVFKWAIPDSEGSIGGDRADDYSWPIAKLRDKNIGCGKNGYIRASKLWEASEGFKHKSEQAQLGSVKQLLENQGAHQWSSPEDEKVEDALCVVLNLISQLQDEDISCLELKTQTESGYDQDSSSYSEAIVNIFNRLNAAGVALGKDEITSAWIRNKWELLRKDHNNIKLCGSEIYSKIKNSFSYEYKRLDDQNIVKLLNILWAVFDVNRGNVDCRLFSDSDLLAGSRVGDMTKWTYENWDVINNTLESVSDFLTGSKLRFNYHFKSVNLIYCMIVYRYYIEHVLASDTSFGVAEKRSIKEMFQPDTIRWAMVTLFAGKWGKNSDSDLGNFMNHCFKWVKNCSVSGGTIADWRANFFDFMDHSIQKEATKRIEEFNTGTDYNSARPIFYVWNQMNSDKKHYYQDMDSPSLDHIIPQKLWDNALKSGAMSSDENNLIVHEIGNLNELGRVDNSAKNNRTLSEWLTHRKEEQHKIRQEELTKICNLFEVSDGLSKPDLATREGIEVSIGEIKQRSKKIKFEVLRLLQLSHAE